MSPVSPTILDRGRAAPLFSALGDQTRLAVVERLSTEGPLSITRLTHNTPVTRQAITKHLQVLAEAGLVHDLRIGRERIWELDTDRLQETRLYLDQVSRKWDEALERLRMFVEE